MCLKFGAHVHYIPFYLHWEMQDPLTFTLFYITQSGKCDKSHWMEQSFTYVRNIIAHSQTNQSFSLKLSTTCYFMECCCYYVLQFPFCDELHNIFGTTTAQCTAHTFRFLFYLLKGNADLFTQVLMKTLVLQHIITQQHAPFLCMLVCKWPYIRDGKLRMKWKTSTHSDGKRGPLGLMWQGYTQLKQYEPPWSYWKGSINTNHYENHSQLHSCHNNMRVVQKRVHINLKWESQIQNKGSSEKRILRFLFATLWQSFNNEQFQVYYN